MESRDVVENLTVQETNTATEGIPDPSSQHPVSFKLKLSSGTTILTMNGAPPQHVAGSPSSQSVKKCKREEGDSKVSHKWACTRDENGDPK